MNQAVIDHFEMVDPILSSTLKRLIGQADRLTPTKTNDYFADLCETIICQQLSDKAGATIFGRFVKLFPKGQITPERILKLPDEKIRSVGPSGSKVKFIKSLAQSVIKGEIVLDSLDALSDEAVIKTLVMLKGIGPWTAEMFLMFSLGREDVFSYGDLGLRRAIQKLYGFKKEPTQRQMERITKKWSPYRTYACRILWRSLEMP